MQAIITVDFYIPNSDLTGEHFDPSQLNLREAPDRDELHIFSSPGIRLQRLLMTQRAPVSSLATWGAHPLAGSAWK